MHDLCQPLTALECRLYLATMETGERVADETGEMKDAIREAMVECQRLMTRVRAIQDQINRTEQNGRER